MLISPLYKQHTAIRFSLQLKIIKEMSAFRSQVLSSFKKLHRTRIQVFQGDEKALIAARKKINEEFSKNKHVQNDEAIKEMIKFGDDIERELRTQVIQAREMTPGVYEARITEDTLKLENIPYDDSAIPEKGGKNPCCQSKNK